MEFPAIYIEREREREFYATKEMLNEMRGKNFGSGAANDEI